MYQAGDKVDVIDLEGVWREAYILYQDHLDYNKYFIKFINWTDKWNEFVDISRIRPLYSQIKEWRYNLKEGDMIEIQTSLRRWSTGIINKIDKNGIMNIESINRNFKVKYTIHLDEHELYCKINTHF
jgi:hypothetical protein